MFPAAAMKPAASEAATKSAKGKPEKLRSAINPPPKTERIVIKKLPGLAILISAFIFPLLEPFE